MDIPIKSHSCNAKQIIRLKLAVGLFQQALEMYGVPSRVRTDKGGENTLTWRKGHGIKRRRM